MYVFMQCIYSKVATVDKIIWLCEDEINATNEEIKHKIDTNAKEIDGVRKHLVSIGCRIKTNVYASLISATIKSKYFFFN